MGCFDERRVESSVGNISREGNNVIVRRKTEVYVEVESISDDEGFLGNRMISS